MKQRVPFYTSFHFSLTSLLNIVRLCTFPSIDATSRAILWVLIVQPKRTVYNYSTYIHPPLTRRVTFIATIILLSNFTVQQAVAGWLWQSTLV